MYFIIPIILVFAIFFIVLFHFRKKKIIRKICCMSPEEKCCLLNEIVNPLGYDYDPCQDIFTSRTDAWQKKYGYTARYDKLAPYFNMVFDCLPIYFDYDGKTWLIEFWKGQYGINTGAEIGVYCADRIVPPHKRHTARFFAVSEENYLDLGMELYHNGKLLACRQEKHWWLTAFCMGYFANPCELSLNISIRFSHYEMCHAFTKALQEAGYHMMSLNLCLYCADIPLLFDSAARPCLCRRILRRFALWKDRRFYRLYCFVTRCFTTACDKLLYLYFYLPFAFRRMLRLKRFRFRNGISKRRAGRL